MQLHYIGSGRYVVGIPTADLDTEDEALAAEALASGLYELVNPEPEPEAEPVVVKRTTKKEQ